MAKKALQSVLENTIGQYVRGLDPESLNVGIWSGKIELNTLELNVDAVNLELDRQAQEAPNLAIPFKVVSGGFKSFNVSVPWANLASSPVILRLSGLSIIVAPHTREPKADKESLSMALVKKQRGDSIEHSNNYRQQKNEVKKLAGSDDSSKDSGFVSRLVRRIVENIQIEITDVHISLEADDGSAGVVLDSLSLVTTDKDGNRTFVDRTTGSSAENFFLFKALELKGFGIYLDEPGSSHHSYILAPLSFTAKLRQADGTVCMDYYKYQLSSELSSISIGVTRNQIDVAENIGQVVASKVNGPTPLFPEYRPLARISGATAKQWWRYAKRCISRMNGRSSWAEFFLAFKKRKTYVELYKRHTQHEACSWLEPLSKNEISALKEIEHDRTVSVSGLMLWRDMADAQVDLEKTKREGKGKKESKSLFFRAKTSKGSDDDAPIELTIEELKTLEDLSMQTFADEELSKDSKLLNASFVLKSMEIVLTSYHSTKIAALKMGEVDLGLNARADGAFAFNYDMMDLKILDLATENTLFPNVLRSLPVQGDSASSKKKSSVHVQISKSKTGDQKLLLRITAFEAVASPVFFKELITFAKSSPTATTTAGNAMKSASGSVDDVSNALVSAWRAKTETKVSWVADLDIHAPILVVPEKCTGRKSNVLVLDLGSVKLHFGKETPAKNVLQWFRENKSNVDVSYESGRLETKQLTFKVTTVSEWLEAGATSSPGSDIIAPISAKLDFGIEQSQKVDEPPRVCCIGVIPSITFLFSLEQGAKLFPVVKAWGNYANQMSPNSEQHAQTEPTAKSAAAVISNETFQAPSKSDVEVRQNLSKTDEEYMATFFFKIGLQRLSTILTVGENERLEAHLVSVLASTMVRSNGSSSSNLRMGWFWVLDMLKSDITRHQRLLAHSKLTKDPSAFAEGQKYDMLDHLVELGVFKEDYGGSTDLADISIRKLVSEYGKEMLEDGVDQILDARFSSLFIHFNPMAMKGLTAMIPKFTSILEDSDNADDTGGTESSKPSADTDSTTRGYSSVLAEKAKKRIDDVGAKEEKLLIKFQVESLDIYLNSPSDDLPRFLLNVDQGDIKLITGQNDMNCHVSLRNMAFEDIRQEASHRQYRHLIDQGTQDSTLGSGKLFLLDYVAGSKSTSVDLVIGAPQLVFIPDAVSDLAALFQVEQDQTSAQPQLEEGKGNVSTSSGMTSIDENKSDSSGLSVVAEDSTPHKYNFSVKTQLCSMVLVDVGSEQSSAAKKADGGKQHNRLMETIVLQGIFETTMTMDAHPATGEMTHVGVQAQAQAMEIFSAFGREMLDPLQILEPVQAAMQVSTNQTEAGGTDTDITIAVTTDLEFFLSMRNVAMLSTIVATLNSSSEEKASRDAPVQQLSTNEAARIEKLSHVLDETSTNESIQRGYSDIDQGGAEPESIEVSTDGVLVQAIKQIQVKITLPQSRITVINDLQGLDEAIFRVSAETFVAGGKVIIPVSPISSNGMQNMTFDFHMDTSILADYFDSSVSLWSKLLIIPWAVNLKVLRSPNRRFKSARLSSTIDLGSLPCRIAIAPEFLVSLSSVTQMWSAYSFAVVKEDRADEDIGGGVQYLKKSMAASAARNLLTSLPYAIENHCGSDAVFSLPEGSISQRKSPVGSILYFRFQPPKGTGHGGRRRYGQEVNFDKSVTLTIGGSQIEIPNLDTMLGSQKQVHKLADGRVLLTFVAREGKTTVLHLASTVSVFNRSSVPFAISIGKDNPKSIGTCNAHEETNNVVLTSIDGVAKKPSNRFSIPMDMLTTAPIVLHLSPKAKSGADKVFSGVLDITSDFVELAKSGKNSHFCRYDLTCQAKTGTGNYSDAFVVQVLLNGTLHDDNTVEINVFLQPRAVIENLFPVGISVRSKMHNTFSSTTRDTKLIKDDVHELHPGGRLEVFSRGDSVAMGIKPSDEPTAGSKLSWMNLEVPLTSKSRLRKPMTCKFPFSESEYWRSDFFIAEGYECLDQLSKTPSDGDSDKGSSKPAPREISLANPQKSFYATVRCYGVDHTGEILFEKVPTREDLRALGTERPKHHPYGAFSSGGKNGRLTMLPGGDSAVRLLKSTTEGYRATMPFTMNDLVIGDGGINALAILWENKKPSGYFAYRHLVNEHQSEIHIVPEFIIFNGSNETVVILEEGKKNIRVDAGQCAPLKCESRPNGLELAINFIDRDCKTKYVRVDQLCVKMQMVHSNDKAPIGSVCVQTALDTRGNARLVVKIGEITKGLENATASIFPSLLANDFIRFRVRWSELDLVLKDSGLNSSAEILISDDASLTTTKRSGGEKNEGLMSVNFSALSVDIQRVFKEQEGEDKKAEASPVSSPERCQITMVIHEFQVLDMTPGSKFPVIFGCSSAANFLDVCIRTRGALNADIANVDLLDLSLAHLKGKSEKIRLTTSEEYVWKMVDLMSRISEASKGAGDYHLELTEDPEKGRYVVAIEDGVAENHEGMVYSIPRVDQIYDVELARVSPFAMLVSFHRTPDESRYEMARNVRGAALTNYFTRQLKFSIDNAVLNFARYEKRNLKGPSDRLIESVSAVYISRMKFKVLSLLSSASLQDWKFLAARDGDDEFVEGDVLRATGNIAGMTAGALLGTVGKGLGGGVSNVTRTLGNGIEDVTGLVGARKVGAGINTVISGVGEGVGGAVTGVGGGAGKIIQGAGQGVGQVVGGVLGGAFQMGKGIGEGIVKGDGNLLVSEVGKGAGQIGGGVVSGAGSVLQGATDGIMSAGKGLFSFAKKKDDKN